MPDLQASLQRIDHWVMKNDSNLAKKLRDQLKLGLSKSTIESEIAASLSRYNRKEIAPYLPEEIVILYQWHDGRFGLSNFASFHSLNTTLGLQALVALTPEADAPKVFLPLLSTEYYFCGIFCDKTDDKVSPIYHFDNSQGNFPFVISPSLENLMTAIAECLEEHGGFSPSAMALDSQGDMPDEEFYGSNGYCIQLINLNDSKLASIYERYNVDWKWFLP